MKQKSLTSKITSGIKIAGLVGLSVFVDYTLASNPTKTAEQKAKATYHAFSDKERKEFDKYFDADYNQPSDFVDYTLAPNPAKTAEQKAQQTYNSFSKEERKEFDKYFDVDFSKLEDSEVSFLQDVYEELFDKGTFSIRKMNLRQKLKIFNHFQKSGE